MWTSITILGVLIIIISAILTYILITESQELRRRTAELKDWFAHLSAVAIRPQPDWPAWAHRNYNTFYKDYQADFEWCEYRMQHAVFSKYTLWVLEEKFNSLHHQQQDLQRLLQTIEKYRKVPEMKKQVHERLESFRSQIEQLQEGSPLRFRFEAAEDRLNRIQVDDQDMYPDAYSALESVKWDLDWIEKDLDPENKLRVA